MKKIIFFTLMSLFTLSVYAKQKSDAHIIGHVTANAEHISHANVYLKGTIIGTATDETGHFQLLNVPLGECTLVAQVMGYVTQERIVKAQVNKTVEVKFDLKKDVLELETVVVTGDRNAISRIHSPVIVTPIAPQILERTQSLTIGEGLNYCPGLRLENNCQNCGFTQLRMNGMEGAYSQILINGRSIFKGLAGVYALEMIPANMIERMEVVRGGGSALYGSSSIAGNVNLILKDPIHDELEFDYNSSAIGIGTDGSAEEQNVSVNASVVTNDQKAGLTLYGYHRDRNGYDANDDGFTEMSKIDNTTFGTRVFHRLGKRSKLSGDFFVINEERRGGDRFDLPLHESGIAEAVDHKITSAAFTYEQYVRKEDMLTVYSSLMNVNRDAYYGAEQALDAYGRTKSSVYSIGSTFAAKFDKSNAVVGAELNSESLVDKKLGYPDYDSAVIVDGAIESIPHTENILVSDQRSDVIGFFGQYDYHLACFKIALGLRFDHYNVSESKKDHSVNGNVWSPRLNFLYDITSVLQARAGYSRGYRAPQIFDEDLHIETSGARRVLHENADDLEQENSNTFVASLNYHTRNKGLNCEFLAEGFYTVLENPFANEFGEPDEIGSVVYTRINADGGASVRGVNMELNFIPSKKLSAKLAYTLQSSQYEKEQEFREKSFFRTPDDYGSLSLAWTPTQKYDISLSGIYTGKMLVPFFGVTLVDPQAGVLRESERFFDLGAKIARTVHVNGTDSQVYVGVKNLFNAFQDDFDSGIARDPGYIYGPMMPRTFYAGFKIFTH